MKQEVGTAARAFIIKPIEDPYAAEELWIEFLSDGSFAVPEDIQAAGR